MHKLCSSCMLCDGTWKTPSELQNYSMHKYLSQLGSQSKTQQFIKVFLWRIQPHYSPKVQKNNSKYIPSHQLLLRVDFERIKHDWTWRVYKYSFQETHFACKTFGILRFHLRLAKTTKNIPFRYSMFKKKDKFAVNIWWPKKARTLTSTVSCPITTVASPSNNVLNLQVGNVGMYYSKKLQTILLTSWVRRKARNCLVALC